MPKDMEEAWSRVVTIDGPASSGKSTVASKLARRLGLLHLNSGLLYRAVGSLAAKRGIDLGNDLVVSKLAENLNFSFELKSGSTFFLIDGMSASRDLASAENSRRACLVALLPGLRKILTEVQRQVVARSGNVAVLEGRDAGTVVFPEARFKFYLDAKLIVRAKRRVRERLKAELESGRVVQGDAKYLSLLAEVEKEIAARDLKDESRDLAPNKPALDAVIIDTSELGLDEVLARITSVIRFS